MGVLSAPSIDDHDDDISQIAQLDGINDSILSSNKSISESVSCPQYIPVIDSVRQSDSQFTTRSGNRCRNNMRKINN